MLPTKTSYLHVTQGNLWKSVVKSTQFVVKQIESVGCKVLKEEVVENIELTESVDDVEKFCYKKRAHEVTTEPRKS